MKKIIIIIIILIVFLLGFKVYNSYRIKRTIKKDITDKIDNLKNRHDAISIFGKPNLILTTEDFANIPDSVEKYVFVYTLNIIPFTEFPFEAIDINISINKQNDSVVDVSVVRD